jgi:phosphopantothenoylcysteine decarboxylase/phosphopantothenate--cysteine ligase
MSGLDQKRILLGVSGGIAAYKTPELVRRLRDAGADVSVILTKAGGKFVSSLALEVLSGNPVGQHLWSPDGESQIVHTDLGKDSDLIVLAPATANLIARIRHGFADDLLATTVMACQTPVLVCPSMNTEMLDNPLVRENLSALESQGRFTVLEPDAGQLACGVIGPGRLPEASTIVGAATSALTTKNLADLRVMVTAGPTIEDLDPVRFLSNRSTGTMGFELARALADRGASVTLVTGPVSLGTPAGVRRIDVRSAADLAAAVDALWPDTDALFMAAAVADYRPSEVATHKLVKSEDPLQVDLERTRDILATLGARDDRASKLLIGFAAETQDLTSRARAKLQRKGLDWIVANDVSGPETGFGTGENAGVLLGARGEELTLERQPKARFADALIDALTGALEAAR